MPEFRAVWDRQTKLSPTENWKIRKGTNRNCPISSFSPVLSQPRSRRLTSVPHDAEITHSAGDTHIGYYRRASSARGRVAESLDLQRFRIDFAVDGDFLGLQEDFLAFAYREISNASEIDRLVNRQPARAAEASPKLLIQ
jgi:hypothetical protein